MALTTYVFTVRNNSTGGTRVTGLTPTWVFLKTFASYPTFASVGSPPAFTELGEGAYTYQYDPVASGEAIGQINANGSGLTDGDNYIDVSMWKDSSGSIQVAPNGIDLVVVETGVNARQALSPILAAAAGQISGQNVNAPVIQAGNNPSQTRISATTDGYGNRTAVTLTIPT